MSTALGRSLSKIRIVGPPGLARELVSLLLHVDSSLGDGGTPEPAELPALVVLVDPEARDWHFALALGAPLVLVTGRRLDLAEAAGAVLRGAGAVVHAASTPEKLLEAVRVVMAGGTLLDPHEAQAVVLAARDRGRSGGGEFLLTSRERQILISIERGEAVKQTAVALGISAKTVESLQSRLFIKLRVRSRAQALARAHDLGLLNRSDDRAGSIGPERVIVL